MSLTQNIDFVNSLDGRLKVLEGKKPVYQLPQGTKSVEYRTLPSANGDSIASSQYVLQLQQNQILGNYLIEETVIDITLNVTATQGNIRPFQEGYFAPKFMPLTYATSTLQLVINGNSINISPADILNPLWAFNKSVDLDGRDLPTCSLLDAFSAYTAGATTFDTITGSLKNPLLGYFASTYGIMGRSCVELVQMDNTVLTANTAADRHYKFIVREPIWTGVTSLTTNYDGFVGATNVQIVRNFTSSNLVGKLINYFAPGNVGVNSTKVAFSEQRLYYVLMTPDDDVKIPYPTYYPLISYDTLGQSRVPAVNNGATITANSSSIALNYVPKCLYVWVAAPASTRTITDTAAPGFQITNVNISYNGVGGQFAGMAPIQIYSEFCARQGFVKSFFETGVIPNLATDDPTAPTNTFGAFGSVLRIDASQLPLPWDKVSVGSEWQSTLQVSVQCKNITGANFAVGDAYLYVQVVNDGVLCIPDFNSAVVYKGILNPEDVQKIRKSAPYETDYHPALAGSFFKRLLNNVKKVGKYALENKDTLINLAKGAHKALASGRKVHHRKSHKKASALLGGKRRHHRRHSRMMGGNMIDDSFDDSCSDSQCSCNDSDSFTESEDELQGGRIISKADLQRRL